MFYLISLLFLGQLLLKLLFCLGQGEPNIQLAFFNTLMDDFLRIKL